MRWEASRLKSSVSTILQRYYNDIATILVFVLLSKHGLIHKEYTSTADARTPRFDHRRNCKVRGDSALALYFVPTCGGKYIFNSLYLNWFRAFFTSVNDGSSTSPCRLYYCCVPNFAMQSHTMLGVQHIIPRNLWAPTMGSSISRPKKTRHSNRTTFHRATRTTFVITAPVIKQIH